jgi:DNA primase
MDPGLESSLQEPPVPRYSDSTIAAIKQAVDIVTLVGAYLPLHRSGSKYKALCPFHDDHTPSLELNPDHQSYKCWACGAGGDALSFVQAYERVDFPEALRMLADRAGIALDTPVADRDRPAPAGPSKSDLIGVMAWAQGEFSKALVGSDEARAYLDTRGLTPDSSRKFALGFSPDDREWLQNRARRSGVSVGLLEAVGLVARREGSNLLRDRFRARVIFPIHDFQGRPIAFGGRILPEIDARWAEAGFKVGKYVNSPETVLFQKRKHLYAADLARAAARQAGWVAVVEGYTDVIAAHQVGLENVVGTLGTALGDEHIQALRRLADRVVLVFDGDEAGQKAADRSVELFLGHEVDVRVLTLPEGLDPCDFLLKDGAEPFRAMVERAADPLDFAVNRAAARYDVDSPEGARQAAAELANLLARVPRTTRAGLDVKVAKALDSLAQRLRLPVHDLKRLLQQARRPRRMAEPARARDVSDPREPAAVAPVRISDLDPLDRELVRIVLNAPELLSRMVTRVTPGTLRDAPLRRILEACYDCYAEGVEATFDRVSDLLDDADRSLAAGLLLPADPNPLPQRVRQPAWEEQLALLLDRFAERAWSDRLRDLKGAMEEVDPAENPAEYEALRLEYFRLHHQRPEARRRSRPDPSSV